MPLSGASAAWPAGLLHRFKHEKSLTVLRRVPVRSGAGTMDKVALILFDIYQQFMQVVTTYVAE